MTRRMAATVWMACAGAAVAWMGCGGQTATGAASDASADRTTASDGSTGVDGDDGLDAGADTSTGCGFGCNDAGDAALPPCPASPPATGSACSTLSQVCEYGSSWWLGCNVVVQCLATPSGGSAWSMEYDGGQCSWLDAGGPCPATWDAAVAVDAGQFNSSCPFVTCVYPEGFCGCGIACGGGGGAPHPMDVMGVFTCIPTQPGCPEPRPLSGTACGDSGTYCNYGFACGCGEMQQCVDGMWQAHPSPPCP